MVPKQADDVQVGIPCRNMYSCCVSYSAILLFSFRIKGWDRWKLHPGKIPSGKALGMHSAQWSRKTFVILNFKIMQKWSNNHVTILNNSFVFHVSIQCWSSKSSRTSHASRNINCNVKGYSSLKYPKSRQLLPPFPRIMCTTRTNKTHPGLGIPNQQHRACIPRRKALFLNHLSK